MRCARIASWLGFCLLIAALSGCSFGIGVRKVNSTPLLAAWKASIADTEELSPRTLQTLRQLDLANTYQRHPEHAYAQLHRITLDEPQQADLLFALSEMSYHLGRAAEKRNDPEAVCWYYLCSGYAYHFLFPSDVVERADLLPAVTRDAFDPRFRLACDLYNSGLSKCIRAAQRVGRLDPRHHLHLPGAGDGFTLSVKHHGFAWEPEEFGPLLFCSDYEVVGLDNHFRTYGLGVPLIGMREATAANAAPGHAFYPREVSFPVTAFFRFRGSLADLAARRAGRLELYNPLTVQSVQIAGKQVPLETDLTTPLAYFLSRTDLEGIQYAGFLRADTLRHRQGIYLFEPYQPGKIPVLMVHGILSSPLTWTPLFNELRADPELRKHFQFWFYLYPTGNPYIVTAADLRVSLDRLRYDLDPHRRDPALDQMVFVGHSMGGLVSKMLTQSSDDQFWRLVSKEPFEELKGDPETRQELQRIFFFDRESCI
ncbi:MAG TPA: hypothetical protein VEL76_09655, partial [Gemmataceae bacterium]|nr:hypothetical protein [Gemmataceae bacterium]